MNNVGSSTSILEKPIDHVSILIAEDDLITRRLIARLLRRYGHEVEEASDGLEALAKIQRQFFPVLITEWKLPSMDGLTLCRRVRALELEGYVYILMLTNSDSRSHFIEALEAGVDDYLTKPPDEHELTARLRTGTRINAMGKQLRKLLDTDPMTEVYNRRYLSSRLPIELARRRELSRALTLVMGDIDFFKKINDQWGHGVGDQVIVSFAQLLHQTLGHGGNWVARYGGEEFLAVLPGVCCSDAVVLVEEMRATLTAQAIQTKSAALNVTASFGIASVSRNFLGKTFSADEFLKIADDCLYESKKNGRNRITAREITEGSQSV